LATSSWKNTGAVGAIGVLVGKDRKQDSSIGFSAKAKEA